MKKVLIFSFLIFIGLLNIKAQESFDSLLIETKKSIHNHSLQTFKIGNKAIQLAQSENSPTKEAQILKVYGDYYYYLGKIDSAKIHYINAIELAKKDNNIILISNINIYLFIIQTENNELKKGMVGLEDILKNARVRKDTLNIIESLNALAGLKENESKKDEAYAMYLEALKLSIAINNRINQAIIYNNIGLLKWSNQQNDAALSDFKTSLILCKIENQQRLASRLNNNIGLIYSEKKAHNKAINYFKKLLLYAEKAKSPKDLGISYLNIGSVYIEINQFNLAVLYLDSAVSTFEAGTFGLFLCKGYIVRAVANLKLQQYNQAEIDIDKSFSLAIELNSLEDISLIHKYRSQIEEGRKNTNKALIEHKLYKKFSDSIAQLNNKEILSELQVQYDVEKKETALLAEKAKTKQLQQEQEIAALEFKGYIALSVIISILIMIFLLIRHYKTLNKQQEQFAQNLIENIDKERERISKDLHDDLGQRMSIIKNKLHLSKDIDQKNLVYLAEELGELIESTRTISHELHPSFLTKIGLENSIKHLFQDIEKNTGIICSYDFIPNLDELFNLDEKTHLYRIIQECVNNTIKHANATALKMTIVEIKSKLMCTYQDNGIGIKKEDTKKKGIGLLNISERAKIINGNIAIKTGQKGMSILFEFTPKSFIK